MTFNNDHDGRTTTMPISHLNRERAWADSLDFDTLEAIMFDGIAETSCGCRVEPDGSCEHGNWSPLILLGLI